MNAVKLAAKLAVICPMANEAQTATRFVQAMLQECSAFTCVIFYAVLDNASRDGTRQLMEEFAATEPRLQVVWAPENRHVVDAYMAGYRAALSNDTEGPDWVLEIDAGFSHSPAEFARFIPLMQQDYDCLFGSRFCQGADYRLHKFSRYVLSKGGTWLANALLGTRLTDMTSGYQAFRTPVLRRLVARGLFSEAHFFQTEIRAYCSRLAWREVPISYQSPSPSVSSGVVWDALSGLWRLLRLRWQRRLFLRPDA